MAINWHDDIEVMTGDTFTIPGTLQDVDGNALDLSDATVLWTLIDPDGVPALTGDDATISISDQGTNKGQLLITVPASTTTRLLPGIYTDALRVELDEARTTMWLGSVYVDQDPFA